MTTKFGEFDMFVPIKTILTKAIDFIDQHAHTLWIYPWKQNRFVYDVYVLCMYNVMTNEIPRIWFVCASSQIVFKILNTCF